MPKHFTVRLDQFWVGATGALLNNIAACLVETGTDDPTGFYNMTYGLVV